MNPICIGPFNPAPRKSSAGRENVVPPCGFLPLAPFIIRNGGEVEGNADAPLSPFHGGRVTDTSRARRRQCLTARSDTVNGESPCRHARRCRHQRRGLTTL